MRYTTINTIPAYAEKLATITKTLEYYYINPRDICRAVDTFNESERRRVCQADPFLFDVREVAWNNLAKVLVYTKLYDKNYHVRDLFMWRYYACNLLDCGSMYG